MTSAATLMFVVMVTLPMTSEAVKYVLAKRPAESCDSVCKQQSRMCTITGHGFPEDTALPILNRLGAKCDETQSWTDDYIYRDNPVYMKNSCDSPGLCIGFKGIPDRFNCSYGKNKRMMRLCPCVKGVFDPFVTVATHHGATSVTNFNIGKEAFLAYSRYRGTSRSARSKSYIFRFEKNSFVLHQTLQTSYSSPSHIGYFRLNGDHMLAVPYSRKHKLRRQRALRTVETRSVIVIFKFNAASGLFVEHQQIQEGRAYALSTTFIEIGSSKYLAVMGFKLLEIYKWFGGDFKIIQRLKVGKDYIPECSAFKIDGDTYLACAVWGYYKKSMMFRWTGNKFTLHQMLPIGGYVGTAESLNLKNETFLVFLAKRQKNFGANLFKTKSPIFRWNRAKGMLEPFTTLDTMGASACRPFMIGNDAYLVVSQSAYRNALVFKYTQGKFVMYQEVPAPYAADATFFTHRRIHYIAFATNYFNNSPIFEWA